MESSAAAAGVVAREWTRPMRLSRRTSVRENVATPPKDRSALRFILLVYFGTRALYLLIAAVDVVVQHRGFGYELSNWDGVWYLRTAVRGYPHLPLTYQTSLGFLPVYPMAIIVVAKVFFLPYTVSGLAIAGIGGLVTTRNVYLLAQRWWGEDVARRSVVAFCFFPGSIVFSMLYSEGLLLALATGALLALEDRRFWRAGLYIGIATGIAPDAEALVFALAVVGLFELRQHFSRKLAVEVAGSLCCSLAGIAGFALFLWSWTGTPLASLHAQQKGWGERFNVLALMHQTDRVIDEFRLPNFSYHDINWNLIVGDLGVIFLIVAAYLLIRYHRHEVSLSAFAWTAGVAFLMLTSQYVPPNPRLLLTAFPLVIVFARRLSGRAFSIYIGVNAVFLVAMSMLTFVGISLRP